MYKFLCEHMFSILLCIYLGVEVLDYVVTLCSIWGCQTVFQSGCTILHPHQWCMGTPVQGHFNLM